MAKVTSLDASRILAIEQSMITSGRLNPDGHLVLTKYDGTDVVLGNVIGEKGDTGPNAMPTAIPPTPNTAPLRNSEGRMKAANPQEADDVVTKDYLFGDAKIATDHELGWLTGENQSCVIGDGVDLNSLTHHGVYFQNLSAQAQRGQNYPYGIAGVLEVFSNKSNMVWQRYTSFGSNNKHFYTRSLYNGEWSPWVIVGDAAMPSPQYSFYNNPVDITATAAGTELPSLQAVTLNLSRPMWVDLRFKALGICTGSEIRASIVMSGANTSGWPMVANSNQVYLAGVVSGGLSVMVSTSQVMLLAPGQTIVSVQAYKGSGVTVAKMNYPILEVIPLRWA